MIQPSTRRDLIERLRFTFITADYKEIDLIIASLREKENFERLCEEFFHGCRIDSGGYLVPSGFFSDDSGSASLLYAMYELLGRSPDTFLLKHRVSRVKLIRRNLSGHFRLPRGLFLLPRLEVLSVRGIGISRLPDDVTWTRRLHVLDLSSNRFTDFPGAILKLTRLLALNLSFNALKILPEELGRLRRLRVLSLRANRLTELPEDWHRFQYLRKLDLSMNRLTELPDSLMTLVSLRDLKLSYNDLSASVEALWEERVRNRENADGVRGSLDIGG